MTATPTLKSLDEFPEDIIGAALTAYGTPVKDDGSSLFSLVNSDQKDDVLLSIATAILTERQRKAGRIKGALESLLGLGIQIGLTTEEAANADLVAQAEALKKQILEMVGKS